MAKVVSVFGQGLSGKLGQFVFRYYSADDLTQAYLPPDMSRIVWTEKQKENRRRMRAANMAAKQILYDSELKKEFIAHYNCKANKVYHTAIKLLMAELKNEADTTKVSGKPSAQ